MNSNTKSHCFGCVLWRAIWWKFANLQVLWQNSQNGSQHFGGGGSLVSVEKNVEILPLPNNGFIKFDRRYSTILRPKASWEKAMLKMEVGGLMGLDFLGGTKHFHWCGFFFFRNPSFATGWFWALFVYGSLTQEPGDLGSGWKHRWKPPQSLYNKKW